MRVDPATTARRAADLGLAARLALADALRGLAVAVADTCAEDSVLEQARSLVAQAQALLAAAPAQPGAARRLDGPLAGLGVMSELGPFTSPLHITATPVDLHGSVNEVVATTRYGALHEGGPGAVHGGFIAAAFDELLGAAQRGRLRVTGHLAVSYRSPALLHRTLRYRTWLERVEGRKAFVRGTLHDGDRLCAEAEALFIAPAAPPAAPAA